MNMQKLVTFAFATKRRKLAMLTVVGLAGIGSLVGGGDTAPAKEPVVVAETPAVSATPVTAVAVPADKCDGVHFNVTVAPGDKRDRDGDGIACEKN